MTEPVSEFVALAQATSQMEGAPAVTAGGGGVAIDDATVGRGTAWSSAETQEQIEAAKTEIREEAGPSVPTATTPGYVLALVQFPPDIDGSVRIEPRWVNGADVLPAGAATGETLIWDQDALTYVAGLLTKAGVLTTEAITVERVASGSKAMTIPAGSLIELAGVSPAFARTIGYDPATGHIYATSIFRATSYVGGAGLSTEGVVYSVDTNAWSVSKNGRINRTTATASSAGNVTQNTWTGKAKIAVGASSVVVSNNLVKSTSLVRAWVQQSVDDITLKHIVRTDCTNGTLTIVGNANATSEVTVAWEIVN